MSENKFRGDFAGDQVTPTTCMITSRSSIKVANRSKKCGQRMRWLVDDDTPQKSDGSVTQQTPIHRSVASTDLTRAACRGVGEPCDSDQNPDVDTGSAKVCGTEVQLQWRERYSLVPTPGCAGTFGMSIVADAVCGSEAECLIEFTVWKTMASPGQKRLWFTVRHAMSPAAAAGIRALEIWTRRKNDYPAKVVFLQK